jgi:POT family proton-dependent oligopeptide transporter
MSLVTKAAPVRIVTLMMGVWFLSSFAGNLLSGLIGPFLGAMPAESMTLLLLVLGIVSGVALWLFSKPVQKMVLPGQ